jgi:hypothetical protein
MQLSLVICHWSLVKKEKHQNSFNRPGLPAPSDTSKNFLLGRFGYFFFLCAPLCTFVAKKGDGFWLISIVAFF